MPSERTLKHIMRSKALSFLEGVSRDLRNREDTRHAASRMAQELAEGWHYEELEREHLGDADLRTGIYAAPSSTQQGDEK